MFMCHCLILRLVLRHGETLSSFGRFNDEIIVREGADLLTSKEYET